MSLEVAKVTYEPFTSLDIECTGLNPEEHTLLEVGAAFYDGVHKTPLTTIEFLVIPDHAELTNPNFNLVGEPIALAMNAGILKEIADAMIDRKKNPPADSSEPLKTKDGKLVLEEGTGMAYLYAWMDHLMVTHNLKKKHILAGKNLNSLDIPFIKAKMGKENLDKVVGFRTLDLTSMFAPFSRKTSPLKDINKLRGLGEVSHRALQDAIETGAAIIDIYEKNLQW